MKCRWRELSVDGSLRTVECVRCGIVAQSTYPVDRINAYCRGTPLPSEWREWWLLFKEAAFINHAARTVAYIRWRASGSPLDNLPPTVPRPQLNAPYFGPGSELARLLSQAGAASDQCGGVCKQWRDQMNLWGVEGCQEHRQEIINRIKTAAYKTWITEQIKIGWAVSREPWFVLSDPVGCIVDEAIRRAAESCPAVAANDVVAVLNDGTLNATDILNALNSDAYPPAFEEWLDCLALRGEIASLTIDGQKQYGLPATPVIM